MIQNETVGAAERRAGGDQPSSPTTSITFCLAQRADHRRAQGFSFSKDFGGEDGDCQYSPEFRAADSDWYPGSLLPVRVA